MRNQQYQRILLITVGLWFTVLTNSSPAENVRIPAKSKALAHYIMAVVEDLNGNDQQAMLQYEKSVKLDPQQPVCHLRLGAYYARIGRISEAVAQLKAAIKIKSDLVQSHYLLALIYSSQKKYDLAIAQYETILAAAAKDDPDNAEVHYYLSQLYFISGKYAQAQLQLSQVLRYQPKNVSALYLEGNVFLELKQKEKAKVDFRKVLSVEPQHDGALNALAYVYAEEGINLDEALRMARKAVEIDSTNGAYHDTLGWVLFKKGLYQESLMVLEKAQRYITDPVLSDHLGDVYLASHEPALARKAWIKSLSLMPRQVQVLQKLEQLNKKSARNEGAAYPSAK